MKLVKKENDFGKNVEKQGKFLLRNNDVSKYFLNHIYLVRNEEEKRKILEKEVVQKGEISEGIKFLETIIFSRSRSKKRSRSRS